MKKNFCDDLYRCAALRLFSAASGKTRGSGTLIGLVEDSRPICNLTRSAPKLVRLGPLSDAPASRFARAVIIRCDGRSDKRGDDVHYEQVNAGNKASWKRGRKEFHAEQNYTPDAPTPHGRRRTLRPREEH